MFQPTLETKIQTIFAFEWHGTDWGFSGQFKPWTCLPQGFKNSPTIFDESLHGDMKNYQTSYPEVNLLQYVDDFLTASKDQDSC